MLTRGFHILLRNQRFVGPFDASVGVTAARNMKRQTCVGLVDRSTQTTVACLRVSMGPTRAKCDIEVGCNLRKQL
jgi:hypothetical protein